MSGKFSCLYLFRTYVGAAQNHEIKKNTVVFEYKRETDKNKEELKKEKDVGGWRERERERRGGRSWREREREGEVKELYREKDEKERDPIKVGDERDFKISC